MSAPFSEILASGGAFVPAAVFGASLMGSLHCASMCGPLVLAVASSPRATALYHLGRLVGYTGLGAGFGLLGKSILGTSMFQILPLASAALIGGLFVFLGYRQLSARPIHFPLPRALASAYSFAWRKATARGHSAVAGFFTGLLSVALPCGWLYGFLLASTAARSALGGATLLLCFWAGTLPALLLGPLAFRKLARPLMGMAPRLSGALLILAGVATVGMRAVPALQGAYEKPDTKARVEAICHH